MKHIDTSDVTVIAHAWIPLSDGVRLAATIWLPPSGETRPVPALLEYLPYRRGDWTAPRDAQRHPWYAHHGYASLRVDMRGCGDSEGVLIDEYHQQEQDDALEVIAWMAAQPWCDGNVGMFGISWGGFNALQVAARRPAALKAIVTVCSTDDRYADDVHYYGGALLGIDMSAWAATMLAFQARPPAPWRVGDGWKDTWAARLDGLRPLAETWLAHQERDDYWRHGSVCEDYRQIDAAVLAVGGWADAYRNAVLRLVANLEAPCRGLIGPWSHQYPDIERTPGPNIGFLQETLRWWDHWLKGIDNDVMATPRLRVYHQDAVPPATHYPTRPGRWVGLSSWPSSDVTPTRLGLSGDFRTLSGADIETVDSPQHTGIDAGRWFPFGNASDLPPDQRAEDGRSVLFDTPPLTAPLNILGNPVVDLRLRSSEPRAAVIARLCDVAPGGASTLITRGALNLMKRDGMDRADPVPVGEWLDVHVELTATSYQVPPGHRLRLALSTAYWPWVWPHPGRAVLSVDRAHSALWVGDLDPARLADAAPTFAEPEQAEPLLVGDMPATTTRPEREVVYEPATQTWTLTVDPKYSGGRVFPDGLRYAETAVETYTIADDDPLSATAQSRWTVRLQRDAWDVQIVTESKLTGDARSFELTNEVTALLNGEPFRELHFTTSIDRTSV